MKFPRNARMLQGRFDVAPYAGVFFLLVIFLLLTALVPTPGIHLRLPKADGLHGTDGPTISVAIDGLGRFYFENRMVDENDLRRGLARVVNKAREPLTMVIQADESVTSLNLVRLTMLADSVGIHQSLLATLPRVWDALP